MSGGGGDNDEQHCSGQRIHSEQFERIVHVIGDGRHGLACGGGTRRRRDMHGVVPVYIVAVQTTPLHLQSHHTSLSCIQCGDTTHSPIQSCTIPLRTEDEKQKSLAPKWLKGGTLPCVCFLANCHLVLL